MEAKFACINYSLDDVEAIRKEFNINNEERREEAIRIIEEWLLKQDHLTKKKYNKRYLEACIFTSKGSVEAAKTQIDKICTLRTLNPVYFKYTNVLDLGEAIDKIFMGFAPTLTEERYRLAIIKTKPNISVQASDFVILHTVIIMIAQFLKVNDYCRGFYVIIDGLDANMTEILAKDDVSEIQKFLPVLTEGLGCKLKGVIFLTKSKFIETFFGLLKPLLKEKLRKRIHTASSKERLKEYMPIKNLPEEYGGFGKPLTELHDDLLQVMTLESTQELLKEMNSAKTDETKRHRDVFNDQYMGMPGSFRIMTLD